MKVPAQEDVVAACKLPEIDAGLAPIAGIIEQLLHPLSRIARRRVGVDVCTGRDEIGQLFEVVGRAGPERPAVVGGQQRPGDASISRGIDPRTVAKVVTQRQIVVGVLRRQEVVEVQRRLVFGRVAFQAKGLRLQAPLGAARRIVGITHPVVGNRRQVAVYERVQDAILGIGRYVSRHAGQTGKRSLGLIGVCKV